MRTVWYPNNKVKQIAMVSRNKRDKREKLNTIKLELGCADCGYSAHASALEFDHLEDKDFNISDSVRLSKPWRLIEAEIAKCEVVCANCHRIRTTARVESRRGSSTQTA